MTTVNSKGAAKRIPFPQCLFLFLPQFDRLPRLHAKRVLRAEPVRVGVEPVNRDVMRRADQIRAFRRFGRAHVVFAVDREKRVIDPAPRERFPAL